MSAFEKAYRDACEAGLLPGVALMAESRDGTHITTLSSILRPRLDQLNGHRRVQLRQDNWG